MELTIWDVQHGSAAYLKTPTGKHIVIDLGVGDLSERDAQLSPLLLLQSLGVTRLDEVIITHPHKDHLDDIFAFDAMDPRILHRPGHLTDSEIWAGNLGKDRRYVEKYLEINRRYNTPVDPSEHPATETNSGMVIRSFTPTACSRTNLNNHSIVTFFEHAHSVVCLPGDNEAASWRELLLNPAVQDWLRRTNVFVASHHGREAGYCEEVFQYCKPYLIVVSDGPALDTSAVHKYTTKASGWPVHSFSGRPSEERHVVTTRCDGSIAILTGFEPGGRYLRVYVE